MECAFNHVWIAAGTKLIVCGEDITKKVFIISIKSFDYYLFLFKNSNLMLWILDIIMVASLLSPINLEQKKFGPEIVVERFAFGIRFILIVALFFIDIIIQKQHSRCLQCIGRVFASPILFMKGVAFVDKHLRRSESVIIGSTDGILSRFDAEVLFLPSFIFFVCLFLFLNY